MEHDVRKALQTHTQKNTAAAMQSCLINLSNLRARKVVANELVVADN
jgi:hypothetical protein